MMIKTRFVLVNMLTLGWMSVNADPTYSVHILSPSASTQSPVVAYANGMQQIPVQFEIKDEQGEIVDIQKLIDNHEAALNLSDVTTGEMFVAMISQSDSADTQKFVQQNLSFIQSEVYPGEPVPQQYAMDKHVQTVAKDSENLTSYGLMPAIYYLSSFEYGQHSYKLMVSMQGVDFVSDNTFVVRWENPITQRITYNSGSDLQFTIAPALYTTGTLPTKIGNYFYSSGVPMSLIHTFTVNMKYAGSASTVPQIEYTTEGDNDDGHSLTALPVYYLDNLPYDQYGNKVTSSFPLFDIAQA